MKSIEQQVVCEYKGINNISLPEAKKVIENEFAEIVVFLGFRKNMQIESRNQSNPNYTELEKANVIRLHFGNNKTVDEISKWLSLSKVIVKQILADYLGKKVTAASKN